MFWCQFFIVRFVIAKFWLLWSFQILRALLSRILERWVIFRVFLKDRSDGLSYHFVFRFLESSWVDGTSVKHDIRSDLWWPQETPHEEIWVYSKVQGAEAEGSLWCADSTLGSESDRRINPSCLCAEQSFASFSRRLGFFFVRCASLLWVFAYLHTVKQKRIIGLSCQPVHPSVRTSLFLNDWTDLNRIWWGGFLRTWNSAVFNPIPSPHLVANTSDFFRFRCVGSSSVFRI